MKQKTGLHSKLNNNHYLELLIPVAIELLRSTKSKITKDKNGKNVPNLEVTEAVLVRSSVINNYYQQNLRFLYTFVPNKSYFA